LILQNAIDFFGINNFSLMFLLVKDGKFEGFGFVEDRYPTSGIFTNRNLGIAQGVGGAVGLDLVNGFLELDGQVFGNAAGFLPAQDLTRFSRHVRDDGVMPSGRRQSAVKSAITQVNKHCLAPCLNASQTHLFHQAVLEEVWLAFPPFFGLFARIGLSQHGSKPSNCLSGSLVD
jgi:hypothetical protein